MGSVRWSDSYIKQRKHDFYQIHRWYSAENNRGRDAIDNLPNKYNTTRKLASNKSNAVSWTNGVSIFGIFCLLSLEANDHRFELDSVSLFLWQNHDVYFHFSFEGIIWKIENSRLLFRKKWKSNYRSLAAMRSFNAHCQSDPRSPQLISLAVSKFLYPVSLCYLFR